MFHLYGLFVVLLYSLMKGNTMVVMPSFDRKLYLDSVAKYKVRRASADSVNSYERFQNNCCFPRGYDHEILVVPPRT